MILTKPIVPDRFLSTIREMLDETDKGGKKVSGKK
jgi:hypothetical protein